MPPLASAAGSLLAQFFVALTRVRHPRPIHPHGVALAGEMRWLGASASGISWISGTLSAGRPWLRVTEWAILAMALQRRKYSKSGAMLPMTSPVRSE